VLHVHRAERADRLVAALGEVVAEPLDDPLAPEVVAVPTRGVERWLVQRLSTSLGASVGRADGVCANVEFPFPGRLVGGAVAVAAGVDRETDPWLPERSVWPLLAAVEEHLADGWLAVLAAHLGGSGPDPEADRRARRFGVVRHLADLYDRYGVHRPAMVRAWAAGGDTDGQGEPLPAELVWQAQLWRALRRRIGGPSPAERLDGACRALRDAPAILDYPARLSLFGLTRLPASYLDVLAALATARDVHLFLLHPSPVLWARVAGTVRDRSAMGRRRDDRTDDRPRNPLLATWGRDAREMQLVLTGAGEVCDHHRAVEEEARTLLERIQADVRADRAPPGVPLPGAVDSRAPLAPGDHSVQVHACHGRGRQVEVLRDAILHLLAEDPTLEPRDVIVMCPDIEAFAPLVSATFGAGDPTGDSGDRPAVEGRPPDLRVRLADRSLRQTNPVLGVVSELLALASARVTTAQVLDLAGREPVRRRFRLDDDDLGRVEKWVAASGIRWGLDAAHRAPYSLDRLDANTWRAGLDRVLLGVALAEDTQPLVGGVLPLDDVDSGDIDLAGRFVELVDRLGAAVAAFGGARPVGAWAEAIGAAADDLTATAGRDGWQRGQLQRILDDVVAEAAGATAVLALAEIRALLANRLRGRPTRANFRTGHLTICTLVPMRSVPHRVVCLLGLDDGVFPRGTAPDGDDLVARDPRVGDHDPRSEDRQLLLDALLAATDHLVITYSGRDERTNAARPPAVPVGELLDVVDRTVRTDEAAADGNLAPARRRVVVEHPLQPFDPRNFAAGALVRERAWSYDAVALDGARALTGPRTGRPAFLDGPLPRTPGELVELDDLVRFVQHPVKAFLRQRLGIAVRDGDEDASDALPVELDALQTWAVGQRLLDARLAGADAAACATAEFARGTLPPGRLGWSILERVGPVVDALVEQARAQTASGGESGSVDGSNEPGPDAGGGESGPLGGGGELGSLEGGGEPGSVEVNLLLAGGRALVGTVPGVVGDVALSVTYSKLAAKHRLVAWVRLLAITATHPDRPFAAATVGRYPGRGRRWTVGVARITPPAGDPEARRRWALEHLGVLVDLHDRGLREPLPLYCKTSAAYAGARAAGDDADDAQDRARDAWESGRYDREDRELDHQLVLGGVRTLAELLQVPPCADEAGPGWAADEPTRFGRYARRLWDGLRSCEEVSNR